MSNQSLDSRSQQRPQAAPQHKMIFFQNPDSSAYKKNQSHDYFDEQEVAQNARDSSEEEEDDFEEQEFLANEFNCQKNLDNQESNKQPTQSSEKCNAFSPDSNREHKTFGVPAGTGFSQRWDQQTDSVINQPKHQRIVSQSYQQEKSSQKRSLFSQIQHQDGKFQHNSIQGFQNQGHNFRRQQSHDSNESPREEEEEMEFEDDQPQMTEQDIDGHEDSRQVDDYGDEQSQYRDCNQEYASYSQDQDDHEHSRYLGYEDQNYQLRHHNNNDDSNEDENIPISSQSVSPDGKLKPSTQTTKQNEYFEGDQVQDDDDNEGVRDSNIRSSNQTTEKSSMGGDFRFNNNNNMVVERNDRFIIFKMVPQSNTRQSVAPSNINLKHSQQKDQPTPLIGEKEAEFQKSKFYRETVHSMQSDNEDENDLNNYQVHAQEESLGQQHSINAVKNQLINQSQSRIQTTNKPPMIKKSETQYNKSAQDKLVEGNSKNIVKNFESQLDEFNDNQDFKGLKKSFTGFSRSSSDKFSKLQKLEKKNLQDENLEAAEFTMTKQNLNLVLQQHRQPFESKESGEQMKFVAERRQSDSMILVRNSLLQQQQHLSQKVENNHLSTNNTNQNTTNTNYIEIDSSTKDQETELLKMEYMKLKNTYKKLKCDPLPSGRQPQGQNQQKQANIQKQGQLNSHRLENDQVAGKSRKNLQLQTSDNGRPLINSYLSDEQPEKSKQTKLPNKSQKPPQGIYSVQQSTKAKDGLNKNAFKKQQQTVVKQQNDHSKLQQKQSPRIEQRFQNNSKQRQQNNNRNQQYQQNDSENDDQNKLSYSSQEESYITYQKSSKDQRGAKSNRHASKPQKIQKEQIRHRRHHHDDSDSQNQYDSENSVDREQESDSQEYSDSEEERSHHHHRHRHRKDRSQSDSQVEDDEIGSDSYYDSDRQSYDDESGSQRSYDEESQESSERRHRHRHHHHNRNKSKNQSRKRKDQSQKQKHSKKRKVTKTITQGDRKFKININMHGGKSSRQNKHQQQNTQEDYINMQKQIFQQQQQQLMMPLAYQQQQQMLIQQQLALQQQLLLQPPIQAQPAFFNAQPIQNQLGIQPSQIDLLTNLQQQPQLYQKQQQPPITSANISIIQNTSNLNQVNHYTDDQQKPQYEEVEHSQRNMQRNVSGKNLNQMPPASYPDYFSSTTSPRRDQPLKNNYIGASNQLTSLRSPREQSNGLQRPNYQQNNYNEHSSQQMGTSNNNNYLNQIKNRFKTGNNDRNEEFIDDGQMSRNKAMFLAQNNSSPLKNDNQNYNQSSRDRDDDLTSGFRNNRQNFTKFEEARNFQQKSLFSGNEGPEQRYQRLQGQGNKHARTDSYFGQQQREEDENRVFRQEKGNKDMNYSHINDNRSKFQEFSDRRFTHEVDNNYWQKYRNETEELPILKQKKTGEFQRNDFSPQESPDFNQDNKFKNTRDVSQSSNQDNCDLSMDEGVKASTTRQTMQKSPQATNLENQVCVSKKQNLIPPRPSDRLKKADTLPFNKQQSAKKDQDKKGPQVLIIGFDEQDSLAKNSDPFSNKPVLKQREKINKDMLARSKSTKGTTPKQSQAKGTAKFGQRRSPDSRLPQQQETYDQQIKSPNQKDTKTVQLSIPQKKIVNDALLLKKESPLKKAVKDIKQKENYDSTGKNQANNFQNEEADIGDPAYNKGIMIEIFDNKKSQSSEQVSLAEMFKAKKKDADLNINKANQQQDQDHYQLDQDEGQKKEKTKKELFELRKAMMKSKVPKKQDNFQPASDQGNGSMSASVIDLKDKKGGKKEPSLDLMHRLALGKKVQVDVKEMKKLTRQNYENLPEIKKKKEEEKKKLELAARKQAAADYMKAFNEKRTKFLKKKKSALDEE